MTDMVNYSGASGAMTMVPIQLNSFDDPLLTNSTQQPLGYDQWKTLYRKAFVVGTKVKITFYNAETTIPMIVGICPVPVSQGTTSLANYEYYGEIPQNKFRVLSPDIDHTYISSAVSVKKHLQITNFKDNKEDYAFNLDTESPPSIMAYFHTYAQPMDQTSTYSSGVRAMITIDYIIVLFDQVLPSRSTET